MSVSDSGDTPVLRGREERRHSGDGLSLSSLRNQMTRAASPTLDSTVQRSARFREEERLRARLRRDRHLRLKAQSERISAMQEVIASELSQQHEMTLSQLERELRKEIEEELAQLEIEALGKEEKDIRERLELQLQREVDSMREQLEVEQELTIC